MACRANKCFSLVEIILGLALFVLIFSNTMIAFAPTATDYHQLIRGNTVAINLCEWYISHLEGLINLDGSLPASAFGLSNDVTAQIKSALPDAFSKLRKAKILADVTMAGPGLYKIQLVITWGASQTANHKYTLSRLKSVSTY